MRNGGVFLIFALFFVTAPRAGDLLVTETMTMTSEKFVGVRIFHMETANLAK